MKLVVGLGNPGPEYAPTRHNAGFRVVERFACRHGLQFASHRAFRGRLARGLAKLHAECGGEPVEGGVEVALLEPTTYMNLAGQAVLRAVRGLELADLPGQLLLVYDDLDLPFGRLRLRPRGSAGGHRGVADVQARLQSDAFPRLRFGIGRPPPGEDPVEYVLRPFIPAEERELGSYLDLAVDAVESVLAAGIEIAMNRFNAASAEDPGHSPSGLR